MFCVCMCARVCGCLCTRVYDCALDIVLYVWCGDASGCRGCARVVHVRVNVRGSVVMLVRMAQVCACAVGRALKLSICMQNLDGINYIYIKSRRMFFIFTTNVNVSPSFSLELLTRITKLIKDYCGVLSEESIRKNFVLIYELLDEIMVLL